MAVYCKHMYIYMLLRVYNAIFKILKEICNFVVY